MNKPANDNVKPFIIVQLLIMLLTMGFMLYVSIPLGADLLETIINWWSK